ncbi:ATP-binding protein [Deinococcus sp. S9]|uniref:ATP-binding protein n=1 Tax=Deinococcus sp. S9 TaxID=2545754 RepID=UPI001054CC49|nr:ATP-binding protein [Deinococcus sp. S9]TDE85314.1 hypothetical protein E0686_12330 [Deinococcus sp. S9]
MTTFHDLIGKIPAPVGGSLYPTPEQVRAWVTQPETFTDEVHARECQSGFINAQEANGTLTAFPCPRCEAAKRQAALRRQLVASGVDGRYLDTTWADLDVIAPLDRVRDACERITDIIATGASLLLWSPETGSGKTQAAMLAATAAIRAGHTAHVANLARLAVDVRDGYRNKDGAALTEKGALARLTAPDLLVLDDLGAGETDSAAVERRLLFLALDERQTKRLPTIVTANLSPQELVQVFGVRVLARLQPLTVIHVDHKRNFRVSKNARPLW